MSMSALHAQLDFPGTSLRGLTLRSPQSPATWMVQFADGTSVDFPSAIPQLQSALVGREAFISVAQDQDGQHRFVRLDDALHGMPSLALIGETEVKRSVAALRLYARAPQAAAMATGATVLSKELAPHGFGTNYSNVPWLGLGGTRCVLLSDETTLTRKPGTDRILSMLTALTCC